MEDRKMKEESMTASDGLKLPEFPESSVPGTRLVQRAVSISMLIFGIAFVAAAIVLFAVNITTTIAANGTIEPSGMQQVHCPVSGIITRVFVNTGDTVKAGQAVLQLDSTSNAENLGSLLADVAVKEAEYGRIQQGVAVSEREQIESAIQANTRLVKARAYFRKSVADYQISGDPDSLLRIYRVGQHVGLDVASSDVLSAEADVRTIAHKKDELELDKLQLRERLLTVQQIRNQISALRHRISLLRVTSPSDGIVITDQLDRLAGTSTREGDLLFQVANLSDWQAALLVEERDIHEIKIGDQANVEIPAFASLHLDLLKGAVRSIATEAVTSGQSAGVNLGVRYRVTVDLKREALMDLRGANIKPGYTVASKIITDSGPLFEIIWKSFKSNGPSL
jgi:HlyD family secretion protein